jgi:hypothetical protein
MQFTVYTLKDKDIWLNDFLNCLERIKLSNDEKKDNYLPENFKLNEQQEICTVYFENKLVAFSTLFRNKNYPSNYYRILNRSYKDPSIRWSKPAFFILSKIMLEPQIKKAEYLNAECVFVSSEGKRSKWLKKWVEGANTNNFNFIQINGMVKVCGGNIKKCFQNVAYIPLKENFIPNFEIMTYSEWKFQTENEF